MIRSTFRWATVLFAVGVGALTMSGGAEAATGLQGAVTFGGGAITSGGSASFSMGVPTGAACGGPGSSGYRWESFLVSADVDIAALTFSSGPNAVSGKFVVPLYDLDSNQVSTKFPAASPLGLISGIPAISLPNTIDNNGLVSLPIGTYRIGVACTHLNVVEEYWATYLAVSANGSDTPLGISWTVTSAPTPTTTTTTPSSTTAPAGTTTTSIAPSGGATTSTSLQSGSPVPAAGSSTATLIAIGVAMLLGGRFVVLTARRVKVLPPL